ncbi:MAG: PAS domain-containing protein [Cytophagales bacterium]|nr:PAS domain-containing protein [Cytophagales bacterium]MDW8383464.1 PAS domain-containing protein [Flammeovirgaceae bacterium]
MKRFDAELKFIVIVFVMGILALLNYWFYISRLQEQKVNLLRLTEKINANIRLLPLYANLYVTQGDREFLNQTKIVSEAIEEAILMLKQGGEYETDNKIYHIHVYNLQIEDAIENFLSTFDVHRDKIDVLIKETLYETGVKPEKLSSKVAEENIEMVFDEFNNTEPDYHKKVKENVLASADFLMHHNQDLMMASSILKDSITQQIDKKIRFQQTLAGIFIIGIILIGFLSVFFFHYQFTVPLRRLEVYAQAILQGSQHSPKNHNFRDFHKLATLLKKIQENISEAIAFAQSIGQTKKAEYDAHKIIQNPIVRSLVEMEQRLAKLAQEEERRQWSITGIAQISDVLRNNQDQSFEVQCFEFIRALIKYLGCNQGGAYLINDDDPKDVFIELKACYAYNKKKYLTQRLNLREGLLGQCIFERDIIYTDEVPNGYLYITSGLGEANPRFILLAPIQTHQEILGAIELASFHHFKEHEIEFVKTVTERFASALLMYRNNLKTQKLLENSIKLNQELQQRETLLKQQTDELRLYQEELNRKIQELQIETNLTRNVIAAINKTNASIEFDLDGNILDVNEMFLAVMGYQREELIGKNERILLPNDPKQLERHKMMWESLRNGAYMSGEYQRITRFGKEVWLNGTYNPIFDIDGRPYKVLQFAQFTTEEKEKDLDQTSKINALSEVFPLLDLDLERKIKRVNPLFGKVLHYDKFEFKNKNFFSYVKIDELSESVKDIWTQIVEQGISKSIVLPFYTSDGNIKYFYTNFNPIRNLAGKIYKVMVFMVDVTIQKNLEISLLQKQNELSQFINELEFLYKHIKFQKRELESRINMVSKAADIFELDTNGKIILINENLCKRVGKLENQILHLPFSDLFHPEQDISIFQKLIDTKVSEIHRQIIRYISGNPSLPFWGDTTIAPLYDESDNFVKYIGVIFDVTYQVLQEQQLITSLAEERVKNSILQYEEQPWLAVESMLDRLFSSDIPPDHDKVQRILESSFLSVLVLSKDGTVLQASEKALQVLQYENQKEQILNKSFKDLIQAQDKTLLITIAKMLKGDVLQTVLSFYTGKGEVLELKCYAFPIFQDDAPNEIMIFLF